MSKKVKSKSSRKLNKYKNILFKDTGIANSEEPTKFLMICNGGLVSGIDELLIRQVFSEYGEIENVTMCTGKSYCFVTFANSTDAKLAYENLNSIHAISKMNGPLHLMFCSAVPVVEKSPKIDTMPEGLILIENFIDDDEETVLLNCINWTETNSHLGKRTLLKHRRVKHFGYEFNYDNNNVDKDKPLPDKIPEECEEIVFRKIRLDEKLSEIVPWTPDQLTVNEYQQGQGIPRHVDTHSPFETPIMSLSLGADVVMEFKHRDGRHCPVMLPRKSLLIMNGESRYDWMHGITPRKVDVSPSNAEFTSVKERGVRTSFTFRKVHDGPCQCDFPIHCDSKKMQNISNKDASNLESLHVHQVYENISSHFSETRQKPWPGVAEFVESVEPGGILVDIGCGNGKYLGLNKLVFDVGCDRSTQLCTECRTRGNEVLTTDCLQLPFRDNCADAVISIAVIHHLATEERRTAAVREMGRILKIGGRGLVYVWAKEQKKDKVMSSYLKQNRKNRRKTSGTENDSVDFRDIHLADPDNEDGNCEGVTNPSLSLPVHTNRTQFQHEDLLVPWKLKENKDVVFLRYYHVFSEGELEDLFKSIDCLDVVRSYYDQGNWCVMFQRIT